MSAAGRCAAQGKKEAAPPPLPREGCSVPGRGTRHERARGRPSGLKAAAHRLPATAPPGSALTPETTAGPPAGNTGRRPATLARAAALVVKCSRRRSSNSKVECHDSMTALSSADPGGPSTGRRKAGRRRRGTRPRCTRRVQPERQSSRSAVRNMRNRCGCRLIWGRAHLSAPLRTRCTAASDDPPVAIPSATNSS